LVTFDMSFSQNNAQPQPPETCCASSSSGYSALRLPEFWLDTLAVWFAHAESKLQLRNVTDEAERYDHLVGSLPRNSVRLVLDVLQQPDATTPYTCLKQRLLASHELADFQ
jgi:hypothetical protein